MSQPPCKIVDPIKKKAYKKFMPYFWDMHVIVRCGGIYAVHSSLGHSTLRKLGVNFQRYLKLGLGDSHHNVKQRMIIPPHFLFFFVRDSFV